LPSARTASAPVAGDPAASAFSIGEYFAAAKTFLEGPGAATVAGELCGPDEKGPCAADIRLFLAKHGEYYHPCRVQAAIPGGPAREFVLNVAVSEAGKALMRNEYAALERLGRSVSPRYVPEVHVLAEVPAAGRRTAAIFMGEWFSGYHEFHLTRRTPGGGQGLVVWDPQNGDLFADEAQTRAVYARAAYILTHYYDPYTREGIGAWHQAAGDFVVRLEPAGADVRLIAVREHRPLFRPPESPDPASGGAKALLEALLIFFLNLSLRIRVDRLDGTGELAWAGPLAVGATLRGALAALAEKPELPGLPLPVELLFRHALLACGEEGLCDLLLSVASAYPRQAPERELVLSRTREHAAELSEALLGI
jgi:hypothetical protein